MVNFDTTSVFAARYDRAKVELGRKAGLVPYRERPDRLAETLDRRFQLEALIVETEMSDVYRAIDLTDGQNVAVKRALDPEAISFIKHEIVMLARLDHPNAVSLKAVGGDYLVEEFLPGALLGRLNLTPEEALAAGYGILDVMAHAHERGIVIRDLKPDNIIVTPSGEIKLLDLGLAKDLKRAADFGYPGDFFCAPEYAPPELVARGSAFAAPASDYFSLGVSLFECLTRSLPMRREMWIGGRRGIVVYPENGPVLHENNLERVPPHCRPLLSGLLQREPAQRLADPEQARQLISEALLAGDRRG